MQGVTDSSIAHVLKYYASATEYDSNWYKAWHSWAVMNFETVLLYKNASPSSASLSPEIISAYAVPALKGFVRSISLSQGNSALQVG